MPPAIRRVDAGAGCIPRGPLTSPDTWVGHAAAYTRLRDNRRRSGLEGVPERGLAVDLVPSPRSVDEAPTVGEERSMNGAERSVGVTDG